MNSEINGQKKHENQKDQSMQRDEKKERHSSDQSSSGQSGHSEEKDDQRIGSKSNYEKPLMNPQSNRDSGSAQNKNEKADRA